MRPRRKSKPSLIVKVTQAVDDLGRKPRLIEAWGAEFSVDLLTDGAKPFKLERNPTGGYPYRPVTGHTPLLIALIKHLGGKQFSADLLIVRKREIDFHDVPGLRPGRGGLFTAAAGGKVFKDWVHTQVARAAHDAGYKVTFKK